MLLLALELVRVKFYNLVFKLKLSFSTEEGFFHFHFLSFLFDSNVSMKPSLIGLYREKPLLRLLSWKTEFEFKYINCRISP